MKFVLIDIQKLENICVKNVHKIYDEYYLNELVIGRKKLLKVSDYTGCFEKIKSKIYKQILYKELSKLIGKNDIENGDWNYKFSNSIDINSKEVKYLIQILDDIGGKQYLPPDEMKYNITKYIDEYIEKCSIKNNDIKVLLVYSSTKSIDFDVIERCIDRYKRLDIYITEKPHSSIIDRINRINKEKGVSIEFIKYNKKAFLNYNAIYYINGVREDYPRMRLSKNALVIDNNITKCDKYNSNIIYCEKISKNIVNLDELINRYGKICIASMVKRIVN